MGCGCGKRAVEAFEKAGYANDGEWLEKDGERVLVADVLQHHTKETLERPEVTAAAIREAARKAREKAAALIDLLQS
jgi:hypothetical protein